MNHRILKILFTPRHLVQILFFLTSLFIGIQFALFVGHFESGGQSPVYIRPIGVEAFLPVGALASLKYWAFTGVIDPVHPAAPVLLLTILVISFVARKAFCSWICPIGTISELCGSIGRHLLGRNFRIWKWLDVLLRFGKYALLLFFVKLILLGMPVKAIEGLLNSPYWATSDIKMLHFFTGMSPTSAVVIISLAALSTVYQNFWCRYLCPYGAMIGIVAWLSPIKIRRQTKFCHGCTACSRSCPSRLTVHTCSEISSPECSACLTCIESCPEPETLNLSFWGGKKSIKQQAFALLLVSLMLLGIGSGILSGHWKTKLSYDDYQHLIPVKNQ